MICHFVTAIELWSSGAFQAGQSLPIKIQTFSADHAGRDHTPRDRSSPDKVSNLIFMAMHTCFSSRRGAARSRD